MQKETKCQLKNKRCSAIEEQNELEVQVNFPVFASENNLGGELNWIIGVPFKSFNGKCSSSFLANPSAKKTNDQLEKLQQIMETTDLWYFLLHSVKHKYVVY